MKNKKAIYLLFAANSISGVSQGISMIAIPWYIANDLGLPSVYGLLYLGITILSIFWGTYAGTLIDKYDRKRIMQGIQSVGFFIVLFSAIYGFIIKDTTLWMASIVMIATKLIYNIHYPNLYAFAQEITEKEHYGRITSWLEIQGQTTFAIAGAMAGFLMEGKFFKWQFSAWKVHEIFMLDASTYVLALILISLISYTSLAERKLTNTTFISRLKGGLTYLKENPLVFIFGVAASFLFAAILVSSFFILPIYIKKFMNGSESIFAFSEGVFALGSLLSGIFVLSIFPKNKLVASIIFMSIIGALFFFLFGRSNMILLLLVGYAIIGFCNAGIRILRTTYIFNIIPNDIIGRTGSVFMVINMLFRIVLIGLFSIPFFNKGDNIKYSMMILGVFVLSGTLVLIANYRKLAKMNPENEKVN
ncbi:MAG: MFS transporter [Chitinophagales bacterium]